MKPAIIYMLEVLTCSGVLLAAYVILLERRVKFRWSRLYLLLTTAAGALIPLLRIPVWPARAITAVPLVTAPALPGWTGEVLPDEGGGFTLTPESFCLGLYLVGVTLIVGILLWQLVRIRRLRRGAEITRADGIRLVRTRQQIASFSFFRTIYIWDKTPAGELAAILAHESSHIAHRHSVERILMELMKALMWWNPFVWIAARRLTEVEEFEADNDVLNSGYDRADYMQTIFRQLFGYSPEIANGIRNSLTKKRFTMMTKKTMSRYGLLRLAATLPVLTALLCAFGFTTRAAVMSDAPAQTRVTVITYKDKAPLAGALVSVMGLPKGTVTDAEGHAEIDVPHNSTLEISYIGCASHIAQVGVKEREMFMFDMQPETPDMADVAGKPLYLVDGIEMKSIDRIDADRVESITVLKNGSAIAQYGSKARNGVVIVTLKDPGSIGPATPRRNGVTDIAAQNEAVSENGGTIPNGSPANKEAFLIAETMPQFPTDDDAKPYGDINDFRTWVQKNVKYPAEAVNKGIGGRVVLSFVIEKDGSVSNIEALQSPDESLWEEACRVIASSPRWKPGMQRGETVRVKYTLPVDFRLTEESAAPADPTTQTSQSSQTTKTTSAARSTSAAQTSQSPQPAPSAQTAHAARTAQPASAARSDDDSFPVVETMPSFEGGGVEQFRKWVQMHVKYPAEALRQSAYGKVVASFVVGKDGAVSDIAIVSAPHTVLADEVRRVIESSPRWTPGVQRGEAVRVKLMLPIEFAVSSEGGMLRDKTTKTPEGAVSEVVVVGYGTGNRTDALPESGN